MGLAVHAPYPVAVHIFLLRDDRVLMLRRSNTGYEDGRLSVVAGHVEPGESVLEAAVRETREEVDIDLALGDLRVVGVMHRLAEQGRVDFFLASDVGRTEPQNAEPLKCSQLLWAPLAQPPSDTIPYIRVALENFRAGRWFQQFGWAKPASKIPMEYEGHDFQPQD